MWKYRIKKAFFENINIKEIINNFNTYDDEQKKKVISDLKKKGINMDENGNISVPDKYQQDRDAFMRDFQRLLSEILKAEDWSSKPRPPVF